MNYNAKWTEEELEKLTRYYYKGYDDKKIAELLKRSEYAVRNKRNFLDLHDAYHFEWDSKTYNYLIYQLRKMKNLKSAPSILKLSKGTIKNKINVCVDLGYLNKREARRFLNAI